MISFVSAGATRPVPSPLRHPIVGRGWKDCAWALLPDDRLIPLTPQEYLSLPRTGLPLGVDAFFGPQPWAFRDACHASSRWWRRFTNQAGAIAYVAASADTTTAFATSVSRALNVGVVADRFAAIWGILFNFGPSTPLSSTYGGVNAPAVTNYGTISNSCGCRMFGLPTALTGINTAAISWSGSSNVRIIVAAYSGVHQTTPTSDPEQPTWASSSNGNPSMSITAADLAVGVFFCDQGGVVATPNGGATLRLNAGSPPYTLADLAGPTTQLSVHWSFNSGGTSGGCSLMAAGVSEPEEPDSSNYIIEHRRRTR